MQKRPAQHKTCGSVTAPSGGIPSGLVLWPVSSSFCPSPSKVCMVGRGKPVSPVLHCSPFPGLEGVWLSGGHPASEIHLLCVCLGERNPVVKLSKEGGRYEGEYRNSKEHGEEIKERN